VAEVDHLAIRRHAMSIAAPVPSVSSMFEPGFTPMDASKIIYRRSRLRQEMQQVFQSANL